MLEQGGREASWSSCCCCPGSARRTYISASLVLAVWLQVGPSLCHSPFSTYRSAMHARTESLQGYDTWFSFAARKPSLYAPSAGDLAHAPERTTVIEPQDSSGPEAPPVMTSDLQAIFSRLRPGISTLTCLQWRRSRFCTKISGLLDLQLELLSGRL